MVIWLIEWSFYGYGGCLIWSVAVFRVGHLVIRDVLVWLFGGWSWPWVEGSWPLVKVLTLNININGKLL